MRGRKIVLVLVIISLLLPVTITITSFGIASGAQSGSKKISAFSPSIQASYNPANNENFTRPPARDMLPAKFSPGPSEPGWDEQEGLTLSGSFSPLSYNVTAISQQDQYGFGPAYLLNGLSDRGYWYQVGLSYNWPESGGGYDSGFNFAFEVFNSTGASIFPSNGGGLLPFSGTVNAGDIVLLSLYFNSGNVTMYALDWNTGANANQTYSAEGASTFIGLNSPANSNGFFTGLMTEKYYVYQYFGPQKHVVYTENAFSVNSAWMWIDEYNPNNNTMVFSNSMSASYTFNPNTLQTFAYQGAIEASDAFEFVTGVMPIPITLSYSQTSQISGYSLPKLTYVKNGVSQLVNLTSNPTVYNMDNGTSWSVTQILDGSNSSVRSITNGTISGTALTSEQISLTYSLQFMLTVNSQLGVPSGGGWYDAGSNATFSTSSAPLACGNGCRRAFTGWNGSGNDSYNGANATSRVKMDSPLTENALWKTEYYVSISSFPSNSNLTSTPGNWVVSGNMISIFASPNTGWQFESWKGSGNGSFTGTTASSNLLVSSPINESAQFYVGVLVSSPSEGTVTYADGGLSGSIAGGSSSTIYVPPGSVLNLEERPSLFYSQGGWQGSGVSSQNGSLSISPTEPVSIGAVFAYNIFEILEILAIIAAVVILGAVFAIRRKGGTKENIVTT